MTKYLFRRLKDVTSARNTDLLIVMDGDRNAIYEAASNNAPVESKVLELNSIAADTAKYLGIEFTDLEPIFENHFRKNGIRFEFLSDNHWNRTAHAVVAATLEKHVRAKH